MVALADGAWLAGVIVPIGSRRFGNDRSCAATRDPAVRAISRRAGAIGAHWYLAALRAASVWTLASEVVRQRRLVYLIDGQALDLLLVIERLVAAGGGAKRDELDRLLFTGEPPLPLTEAEFRGALGPENYSAYLNYFYGVTVEEALHCAVELEAAKAHALDASASIGIYERIYGRSLSDLLSAYAEERGDNPPRRLAWPAYKSFTYWLFRWRVRTSVAPRVASDTRKALALLRQLRGPGAGSPDPLRPDADAMPEDTPASATVVDIERPV